MRKQLLLIGASLLTAMGMTLIMLVLVLSVVNTAFAAPEVGCTGGCRKDVNMTCSAISGNECTGDSHCGCPSNWTAFDSCPCGFQVKK